MYDSANVTVTQGSATSKDGTQIPYFLMRKNDTKLDGKNPTLLYGYGGFEISLGPHYIATPGLAWIERGGVYVEGKAWAFLTALDVAIHDHVLTMLFQMFCLPRQLL